MFEQRCARDVECPSTWCERRCGFVCEQRCERGWAAASAEAPVRVWPDVCAEGENIANACDYYECDYEDHFEG